MSCSTVKNAGFNILRNYVEEEHLA